MPKGKYFSKRFSNHIDLRLLALLLCLTLVLSACGKVNADPPPGGDTINQPTGDTGDLSDIAVSVLTNTDERQTITWGYTRTPPQSYIYDVKMPDDCEAVSYLNDYFNVTLKGVEIPQYPEFIERDIGMYYGDWEGSGIIPDVLLVNNAEYAYSTGHFRSIPRNMIELYAPHYAALVAGEPYGWDINRVGYTDEYIGLSSYSPQDNQLTNYSVYRLDRLEQMGVAPKGNVVSINDKTYFTETPFNTQELFTVFRAMTQATKSTWLKGEHYGILIPKSNNILMLSDYLSNLMGMWGLNHGNMNDNDKVNVFYASENYKDFLLYMASLYKDGLVAVDGEVEYIRTSVTDFEYIPISYAVGYNTGWRMLGLNGIIGQRGLLNELMKTDYEARFLITPPEIGLSQGRPIDRANPLSSNEMLLMINEDVSDNKLAKILQIFDEVAFDPSLHVIAVYGFEGKTFDWEGKPYDSKIVRKSYAESYNPGHNLLNPHIVDGQANKSVYETGIDTNNPLYLYSISDQAKALNILPYKEDYFGDYTEALAEWQAAHEDALENIAIHYFFSVLMGDFLLEDTWDSYIKELNDNGLQEYLAIIEQYPLVLP